MIEEGMRMRCQNCSRATLFRQAGHYKDGALRLLCECCQANGGVLHRCAHAHPATPPQWLPLLLVGVKIVCPGCKAAYDLGVKIEPMDPEVGRALQFAGLLVGGYILIDVITDILRGRKQRRR